MNSEKQRLVLFLVLAMTSMVAMQFLMDRLGLLPEPPKPAPAAVAEAKDQPKAEPGKEQPPVVAAEEKVEPVDPKAPAVKLQDPAKLVLGSTDPATGYNLQVRVDQKGAGLAEVLSSRFEAERVHGQARKLKRPLSFIKDEPANPTSFGLNLIAEKDDHIPLDNAVWEVVADDQGRLIRPIVERGDEVGQQIVLNTTAGNPPIRLSKTYTLRKGRDALELALTFEGQDQPRRVSYELQGPHGVPIEGEWYTSTYRDIFVGQLGGGKPITLSAYDVVWAVEKNKLKDYTYTELPLEFAGVENQYFAVFLAPNPKPASPEQRWDKETVPYVVHADPIDKPKSDASVMVVSREFAVGPGSPVTHTYSIFAGPKSADVLASFGAEELAKFRKGWQIPILGPLGSLVGKYLITPLLGWTYGVTQGVSRAFGGTRGNYGVAIIMLVIIVRLCLFPLSRKQAIMAKKMQDLQPLMMEVRDKYKDDKEKQMRETLALQKRHGVNMFGGCLPALIQVPIFIGLWQALNNSVSLRHEPFVLWIRNLAAPDMLFRFPFDMQAVPLIGSWIGPYFNVLPLISAALMLVHTKLFSPPATTPEMEQQQKMMKYMVVFMAFMLYKVPSGLGIYFITSSTWAIAERLLLPKTIKSKPIAPIDPLDDGPDGRGGKPGPNGDGSPRGWLAQKLEKLMEEASKDATIRNAQDKARDRGNGPADSGPRPKSKPGKRR